MPNSIRIDPHQAAASCVSGDRIICEDKAAKTPHRTVQRPIAFHGLNPIGDNKVNRDGHCELDDGVVDALPMQNVFWPAIDRAGQNPERILKAQRDACPMVSLDLRHGDHDVRGLDRRGEPDFFQLSQSSSGYDTRD